MRSHAHSMDIELREFTPRHQQAAIAHDADLFSMLPCDIVHLILQKLEDGSVRALGMQCKKLYNNVKSYKMNDAVYYAVTHHMKLYNEVYPIGFSYFVPFGQTWYEPNHISILEVDKALSNGNVYLFQDRKQAESYSDFTATKTYCSHFDTFTDVYKPAIAVVKLHRTDLMKVKSKGMFVTEHVPDCPHPPAPKVKRFGVMITPDANIAATCFALFNGRSIPGRMPEGKYSDIFNKALADCSQASMNSKVVYGLSVVFGKYSFWPHQRFTRHNHEAVNTIAELLATSDGKNINEIYAIIERMNNEASGDHKINNIGDYKLMLEFALMQLNIVRDQQIPRIGKND